MARPVNIKREDILQHAATLFFTKGISATEMKDIAASCGISRSSLYRHFETKEALARVLVQDVLSELMAGMEAPATLPPTGFATVEMLLQAFVQGLKNNVRLVHFLDDYDACFSDYSVTAELPVYQSLLQPQEYTALPRALLQGCADGTVQPMDDACFQAQFFSNSLLAVAQRVLPRGNILRSEQGYAEEYLDAQLALILNSVRL